MLVLVILCLAVIHTGEGSLFPIFKRNSTPMQEMLDMMQQLMTSDAQFDRNFIREARTCMATFDPDLPDVHDKIWQGVVDYWEMGGNPDDRWGETRSEFAECNITVSSYKKMAVYEPCNFASNVAYYNLLMELCNRRSNGAEFHLPLKYINAIGKIVAALPVASSFFHVSNTKLGVQQDVGVINIMAYVQYQAIMDALGTSSSILNDLSRKPRALTSLQLVDAVQKMYSTEHVGKWYKIFDALDVPSYLLSFAGILLTVLNMNFNDQIVDLVVPQLVESFGIAEEDQVFLTNDFLPELRRTAPLSNWKAYFKNNLLGNTIGSVGKLLHAYVWNEYRVFTSPKLLQPLPNRIGTMLLPIVNKILNVATSYQYYQPNFQKGKNLYPGEDWCNPKIAHSKWHIQSAIALVDFLYVGNDMNMLLSSS